MCVECVGMCADAPESSKGWWVPWRWSHRWLGATRHRCWEPDLTSLKHTLFSTSKPQLLIFPFCFVFLIFSLWYRFTCAIEYVEARKELVGIVFFFSLCGSFVCLFCNPVLYLSGCSFKPCLWQIKTDHCWAPPSLERVETGHRVGLWCGFKNWETL